MKLNKKIEESTDKEVEAMLSSWDKIKCYRCGKEISLLNAKSIDDGMFFVCKGGCEGDVKWYEDLHSDY